MCLHVPASHLRSLSPLLATRHPFSLLATRRPLGWRTAYIKRIFELTHGMAEEKQSVDVLNCRRIASFGQWMGLEMACPFGGYTEEVRPCFCGSINHPRDYSRSPAGLAYKSAVIAAPPIVSADPL